MLGGTTTLIGTSTNLVVSGLQEAKYGTSVSPVNYSFIVTPVDEPSLCRAEWGLQGKIRGLAAPGPRGCVRLLAS